MATFVPVVRSFGDGHKDSFSRRSMNAATAVASVARAHGCERADAGEVYTYMATRRFRNPLTYSFTEGHTLKEG